MYDTGGSIAASLVPNSSASEQDLVVDSAVVQFGALGASTTHVLFTVDEAAVRVTLDGSDPTSGPGGGHVMVKYANGVWSRASVEAARFIRDGDTAGRVRITEMVR